MVGETTFSPLFVMDSVVQGEAIVTCDSCCMCRQNRYGGIIKILAMYLTYFNTSYVYEGKNMNNTIC